MNKKNIILTIIIFILCLSTVNAIGIGASPSVLEFTDVLRDYPYEKELKIDNSGEEEITASLTIGEYEDWITVEPGKEIKIDPKSSGILNFKINIPEDVDIGTYETKIHVSTKPKGVEQGMGMVAGVVIKAVMKVTDQEIIEGYVDNIRTRDVVVGEKIKFLFGFMNKGNIRVKPSIKIEVEDDTITSKFDYVGAFRSESLVYEYDNKLEKGNHMAKVTVLIGGKVIKEKEVTFSIIDEAINKPIQNIQETNDNSPNALMGTLIIAGIIIIGLVIYFVVNKARK